MPSVWFRRVFVRLLKFLQIKDGGPNLWGDPILHIIWIILSPLLYFNFKTFKDPNSSSFIIFKYILYDSGVLFSDSWSFYKLKSGDLISGGNKFCRKSELFGHPLLYFSFKTFKDPNSLSFIRFQCLLLDSRAHFSDFWNFCELKKGDLISGANQFCRETELFGSPFCILILKILRT